MGSIIRVQFSGWQLLLYKYIILQGNSLSASRPRVNYLGDNFRVSNFRGAIIQGAIILGGNCLGSNYPGGNCPGSNYLEGNCPGAIIRGQLSRGQLSCSRNTIILEIENFGRHPIVVIILLILILVI